jgi:hypothetical protein
MCIGCVVTPFIGSLLGNTYDKFALNPKYPVQIKCVSFGLSTSLTVITTLAIKSIFKVSLCGAKNFSPARAFTIVTASALVGFGYTLIINYILNHFFSKSSCHLNSHQKPKLDPIET